MRKMKDSGIEWIGEIPESWEVHRIKNHFSIISGSGFKTDYQGEESGDLPVCKASDISNAGHRLYGSANYISQEVRQKEGFSVIPAGSILFAKIGEAMKKNNRTLTMVDACADNNCQAMVPQNIHSEYAYYLFSCIDMQWFDNAGTIPCINNTKLLNFKMAYPNMDEQNHIADYLDRKCAEIDAIIAAKEKTNELLKERRQSIIYEAVTKGLDPTVPMKDSGVEWIGEIPESWEIERLKYHIEFNPTTVIPNYEDEYQVSFLPMECLRRGTHTAQITDYEKVKKGYVIFQDGDVLMAKVTPCLENGNIAIAQGLINGVGFGSTEINVIRCTSIHREYLFYMLQCKTYIDRAVVDMYGVAGLKRLNPSFIPNTKYPIPSSAEQERIAEYLNRVCGEFDALIAANNTTIEKLKEYRQSVIYEAVTGKVEV